MFWLLFLGLHDDLDEGSQQGRETWLALHLLYEIVRQLNSKGGFYSRRHHISYYKMMVNLEKFLRSIELQLTWKKSILDKKNISQIYVEAKLYFPWFKVHFSVPIRHGLTTVGYVMERRTVHRVKMKTVVGI